MASKGEETRQRVIARAAPVFNRRGYWGSSLRELMEATGLEKGGIYNHFRSKEDLAVAAFEHNVDQIRKRIRSALEGRRHAVDRLLAINEVYRTFAFDPPFAGGCPILNTAVESDDTNATLRDRARAAMDELRDATIARIAERGLERGELRPGTDPAGVATVVVSALEGALMLSQLYGDPSYVERATAHLDDFVRSLAVAGSDDHREGRK